MNQTSRVGTNGHGSLRAALAGLQPFASIGTPLEEIRRDLLECGTELAKRLEPAGVSVVDEALRILRSQVCRIAVIGQIKSGKSAFVSALVDRPHLLPNDVGALTPAVTKLHFVQNPALAESIVVTFFSPDEWGQLADGTPPLRELTERLVPGFNPQLLRLQLEAMRQRSEKRLGRRMHELLGQQHTYQAISRGLLERYLNPDNAGKADGEEHYVDIVKTVDLFFGGFQTGYPITLIESPGTNDPYLVRDEITRQNLAAADIYLIVLSAQQPLTPADLAMLRLLRGLNKERIVVFINRIDLLRDASLEYKRLVAYVSERVAAELGTAKTPVIVGSARWANVALAGDPVAYSTSATIQFKSYAGQYGFDLPHDQPLLTTPVDTLREAFLMSSGIPAVKAAISRMILEGNDAYIIRQVATLLLELAKSAEATEQSHLQALIQNKADRASSLRHNAEQTGKWQTELDQLALVASQTREILDAFQETLTAISKKCAAEISDTLNVLIEQITREQTANLARIRDSHPNAREWRFNTGPLRSELDSECLRIYRAWEAKALETEEMVRAHLSEILKSSLFAGGVERGHPAGRSYVQHRTNAPQSAVITLNLTLPWWSAWRHGQLTTDELQTELRRVVEAEFLPQARHLAGSAEKQLNEHAATMVRQTAAITLHMVNRIRRRTTEIIDLLEPRKAGLAGDRDVEMEEFESKADESSKRLSTLSELRQRLFEDVHRCHTLAIDPGTPHTQA